MKSWLVAFIIAASVGFVVGHARTADAGESVYLGTITVTDGSSKNNRTTASPFQVGGNGTKIAIQCPDAGAWVCESRGVCNVGQGTLYPATAQKGTSIDSNTLDAGSYVGGLVSIRPVAGATDAQCVILSSTGQ